MEPTLTAYITGTGAASTVPSNEGAVDATLLDADGVEIGECTLLPRDFDSELDTWGGLDNWANFALQCWLDEQDRDDGINAILSAVRTAVAEGA